MKRIVPFVLFAFLVPTAILPADTPKNDLFGDPLPPGALLRLGTVRWRNTGPIILSAYRPDGRTLVTVAQDYSVRIWDTATGAEIRHFNVASVPPAMTMINGPVVLNAYFNGPALSGDGKTLACGGRDGNVRIWDVDSGKELRSLGSISTGQNMTRLALSHDGKMLACIGNPLTFRIFDTATGSEVKRSELNQVNGFAQYFRGEFAPNGKTLFLAGYEYGNRGTVPLVAVWDATTGKELRRIDKLPGNGISSSLIAVASADHKTVAAPAPDEIVLFDLSNGAELRRIKYNCDYRTYVVFAPDGKTLFAVTDNASAVAVWDVATGKLLRQIGKPPEAIGPGGLVRNTLNVPSVTAVSIAPDGKMIALMDGPTVVLIDAETGKPKIAEYGHIASLKEAHYSQDGKTIQTRAADGSIIHWDAVTGKVIGPFSFPGFKPNGGFVLPSRDGKWVAMGEGSNAVHVFNAVTGKETFSLTLENGMTVGFSPDSQTLALVPLNSLTAQLYDAATGEKRAVLSLPVPPLNPRLNSVMRYLNRRLIFSADNRLIGVTSERYVTLWDLATGEKVRAIQLPENQILRHATISPNGMFIAIEFTDGETVVYELATASRRSVLSPGMPLPPGTQAYNFARLTGDLNSFPQSLAFSPDGRILVRAGGDGKIQFWDALTDKAIGCLEGQRGALISAHFSPDGSRLVTAGSDTTAIVWDLAAIRVKLPAATAKFDPMKLEALWETLGDADSAKAHAAILELVADPAVVAFLKSHVQALPPPDPKRLTQLIADLSDPKFSVREKAQLELEGFAEQAAPAIRAALQNGVSPQARRLCVKMLEALENRTFRKDELQRLRAVQVLEVIATADATALLKELAAGAPNTPPAPQAKAALVRMAK